MRALAALRRAQMFLRALGIEITSVAKAELETTSCGCMLLSKIPSAPSAASVSMSPGSGQRRPAGDFCDNNARRDRLARGPSGSAASQTPWCGKGQPLVTD